VAIFLDAELTVARTKKKRRKKRRGYFRLDRFGNAFVRWWIGAMRKIALLLV
jgi:hypothetical protein